jgi:hypothetical protein
MSRMKWMAGSGLAVALVLLTLGCAGKASKAAPFDEAKGEHPATWVQTHWSEYVKTPDQCRTCHGSTSNPAQAGGIAKVSCFDCHTAVNHPAGWADPTQHGQAAQAAPVADVPGMPPAMAGFAHCAKCHGESYDNGLAVSCKACHTKAPHPDKPWWSNQLGHPNHVNTNVGNASECAKCHLAGANSTMKPLVTPPAGTAPGCFNETLCHGTNIARPEIQGGALSGQLH